MAGDIYYSKRVLGLHCNGSNGGTTFTDNSPTPKTITANGNAQTSTTQSKFNGSSAKFDGTTDYLSTPDHADFTLGANDFTIEAWVYLNAIPGENKQIINQRDGVGATNVGFSLIVAATTMVLSFVYSVDGTTAVSTTSTTALTTGTWHHIAFTRSGNTGRFFFNGVLDATTANFNGAVIYNSTAPVWIGARGADAGLSLDGYIADLLMHNGVAKYTRSFTPPTAAFDDVTDSSITWENEVSRDGKSLRWSCGDLTGTTCTANSGGATMDATYTGGFTLAQSNIAYGSPNKATRLILASNGYISIPNRKVVDFLAGASEFSVEAVFRCDGNIASSQTIITFERSTAGGGTSGDHLCRLYYAPPGGAGIAASVCTDTAGTSAVSSNGAALVVGGKYHVVVVLSGTGTAKTVTLYVNGVAQTPGTFTAAGAPIVAGTFPTTPVDAIGASVGGGSPYFDATVDDVIVYKSALSAARVSAHYQAMLCRDLTFNKSTHRPARSVQLPIHHRGL